MFPFLTENSVRYFTGRSLFGIDGWAALCFVTSYCLRPNDKLIFHGISLDDWNEQTFVEFPTRRSSTLQGMEKIPTKTSSRSKLVSEIERKTGKQCENPVWETYGDLDTNEPAGDVVAIIVDVRKQSSSSGAVYIHNAEGEYLDMVGLDFKGYNVIVPWQTGLQFISYGRCRVGIVKEKPQVPQVTESNA